MAIYIESGNITHLEDSGIMVFNDGRAVGGPFRLDHINNHLSGFIESKSLDIFPGM